MPAAGGPQWDPTASCSPENLHGSTTVTGEASRGYRHGDQVWKGHRGCTERKRVHFTWGKVREGLTERPEQWDWGLQSGRRPRGQEPHRGAGLVSPGKTINESKGSEAGCLGDGGIGTWF